MGDEPKGDGCTARQAEGAYCAGGRYTGGSRGGRGRWGVDFEREGLKSGGWDRFADEAEIARSRDRAGGATIMAEVVIGSVGPNSVEGLLW